MNEIKKCSKCDFEKELSEFGFRKDTEKYRNYCKQCQSFQHKKWEYNNREKNKNYQKQYFQQNREKINELRRQNVKNRLKTDVNFRLIRNTRRRIHHALNGKSKSSSSREILGLDIDTYRKWIEFQFTPEMNWDNIEIDHVKAICLFDVSNE